MNDGLLLAFVVYRARRCHRCRTITSPSHSGEHTTRVCFDFSLRLCSKANYQPYDALRQRFRREYLKQYDTDDTAPTCHLELTSALDSLALTLSHKTSNSFSW